MKRKKIEESSAFDPFQALAQGLTNEIDSDSEWLEKPVDITEFVESRKFLNQKWNGRTGCRPKILQYLVDTMDPKIREAIWLLGKGSGKDYGASILHLYGIYRLLCLVNPQSYLGLAPSPIYFVNTARNDTQAKRVFFTQFVSLLKECPWFQGKYEEPGVQTVTFVKNIIAISVNSQAFGWLGYNTIQWVGDELAFFLVNDNEEESESRAEECWEAAYGSCQTRFPRHYKMIGITTPRYDDDYVMKKFWELKGRDDGIAIQAPTWEINPNISKEDFKHALARDYRRAMRDFGAEPSGVIESFWPDPDIVDNFVCEKCRQCPVYQNRKTHGHIFNCFDYDDCKANGYMGNGEWRDWFSPPMENNEFVMHFDLAKNRDRIGFSLGRAVGTTKVELDAFLLKERFEHEENLPDEDRFEEKLLIKIDAIGFITAGSDRDKNLLKNKEFYYTAIRDKIIFGLIKRGFNVVKTTFDQFQSHDMKQQLEDRGLEVELISLDRTDEIPVAAKYAITEARVEYPYCYLLSDEAKHLKFLNGKKVDHARKGSKDVWDGLAGTIYDCEKDLGNQGSFAFLGNDDD